jgi:hypothetical protein
MSVGPVLLGFLRGFINFAAVMLVTNLSQMSQMWTEWALADVMG